jgi:hypothetical protein
VRRLIMDLGEIEATNLRDKCIWLIATINATVRLARVRFPAHCRVYSDFGEQGIHCRENDTVDQIKVDVEIQKDTKCIVNLSFSSTLYLFTA